ncbi:ATP-binding protein [Endozoicomonas ascidiicola]|uniref:ATP-binding protein n=1 Tax=Endozoicomonas ascidiicola TaxID=1698521 RepID=UPI0008314FF0|nr:ATP-binding protein [Endozoicomonas ascidiicola]
MTDYHKIGIPEYDGNPLIEALPEYKGRTEVITAALKKPLFSKDEVYHNELQRDRYTERLDSCIIPNTKFYKTYKKIYKLLLKSYKHRNPIDVATSQLINHVASEGRSAPYPASLEEITAPSLFLTGLSGMGKTYMVESILKLFFDQVIPHKKYNGKALNFQQLVYVKFNVPSDGSRRTLCLNFFRAVDSAIGTNYAPGNQLKTLNIADLEINMKKVCLMHHIGLIVIDELQNLSLVKSGGIDQAMAFFESLSNEVKVSLLYIGTYDTYDIYSEKFRTARRMAQEGMIDLAQPDMDDQVWNQLVEVLWRYQWVSSPVAMTEEIKKLLYDLTQGVTFCTVSLLKFANVRAIEDDEDSITADIIHQAYKEEFKLFMPALDALREKNYAAYDDLMPLAIRRILKSNQKYSLAGAHSVKNTPDEDSALDEVLETTVTARANNDKSDGADDASIDEIQGKKRRNESAKDVYDRLDSSGFFAVDTEWVTSD